MTLEELRNRYRHDILQLAAKYKLENVRVFGSTVRGNAREDSDIDLLVHPQEGCSLFKISGFQLGIQDLLNGKKVDVISDRAIKEILAPSILSEAVVL